MPTTAPTVLTTNTVPQGLFGPGILWVTRTDIAGATPVNIGYINEFTLDLAFETKQLYGQNEFALLAARGTVKSTGKMKAATLSGQALNTVLLGGTWTPGTQYDANTEAFTLATPPPVGGFLATPPHGGTFDKDLGVVNATTGVPLIYLSTGTLAAGQYHVDKVTGGYTFSTVDETAAIVVNVNYAYTYATAPGAVQIITSNPIGTSPTFQLDYKTTLYGATYYIRLFQAIGGKFALQHKLTDFAMPEYDFEFFANAAQQIGIISLATQA